MPESMIAGRKLALPYLLYLVGAAVLTFPLLFSGNAYDSVDTLFNSWLLDWNSHAATHLQNPLEPPVFQGFTDGAGRSDLLLTQSVLAVPLHAMGVDPLRIHNILFVIFLGFAGFATHLLARDLGLTEAGSWFAGMSFMFLPFFQGHMWHLQLMSAGITVLCIRQALGYVRGERSGFSVSLLILLQGAASLYYWYFLDLALFIMLAWCLAGSSRRKAPPLLGWIVLGNVLLLPLLLGHIANAESWIMDSVTSTDVAAYVSPWHNSILLSDFRQPWLLGEAALWPGITVVLGALVWLVTKKRADKLPGGYYLLVLFLFFILFCLGPTLVFWKKELSAAPFRFLGWLPGIGSIRLPARAAFLFLLPVVIAAGKMFGRKTWLAAAGITLALIEVYPGPIELTRVEISPWHHWLATRNYGRILFLPVEPSLSRPEPECRRLYGSTLHHTPMFNGYSTSLPQGYLNRARILNTWPSDSALNLARFLDIECVIFEGRADPDADMVWGEDDHVCSAIELTEQDSCSSQ